jgi:hypothetical protein
MGPDHPPPTPLALGPALTHVPRDPANASQARTVDRPKRPAEEPGRPGPTATALLPNSA